MLSTIVTTFAFLNIVSAQFSETNAVVGGIAKLRCRTDIEGTINVMWLDPENVPLTYNEEVWTEDDRITIDHPYSREWNLKIDNVHTSDVGNYTCQIDSGVGNKVVHLAIHYPPTMLTVSPDVSVVTGSDVTISCTASGSPDPQINWYKNTLANERELVVAGQSDLLLENITKEVAGSYECEADNGVPPMATDHVNVNVQFLPILTLPYHSFSQTPGRDTTLQCIVTANPLTSHYWMKDGVRLQESEKYRIQNLEISQYTYMLGVFVLGLTDEDYGTYVCLAANEFGAVNESLQIFETINKGSVEVIHQPKDVISKLSQTIKINCTIIGETNRDNLIWWRRTETGYQKLFESNPAASSSSLNADNQNDSPAGERETYTHASGVTPSPSNSGVLLGKGGILTGVKNPIRNIMPKKLEDRVEIQGHYNLILKDVVIGDGGTYGCELVGHRNYTAEVTVVENATCTTNASSILQGDMLNISCSLRYQGGHSQWLVSWQHGDRKLSSLHDDEAGLLRRVVSFRAWDTDSGMYTCEVESGDRKFRETCDTLMLVQEPPPEMLPPREPTGAPSTGIRTNVSMTGIVLGGAMVAITTVLLVILLFTVKYYRKELDKYKSQSGSRYGNGATATEMESLRLQSRQDSGTSLPEEV